MKRLLIISLLCVIATPAFAHHRHYRHHLNPMVAGLAHGFIHMLESIEPHPAGCPARLFCGCGVATKVFGEPRRDLWSASARYKFPRASLSPGNVIVTPHHVQYIDHFDGDGAVCYDPNSGGGLTRMHACRLGGTIVSPRG